MKKLKAESPMDNLLTLLGEARAYVDIYTAEPQPSPATAQRYQVAYDGFMGGQRTAHESWRRAAIRYVRLRRLCLAVPKLEAALEAKDLSSAILVAEQIRESLDVLRRNPAGKRGRRANRNLDKEKQNAAFTDAR